MDRMTWREDADRWRCCCGCAFTTRIEAEEHDKFRCMTEDRPEASVAWMLAAILCAVVIVTVVVWLA